MKARVLESNEGKSVILAEDGIFYNAAGSYEVGDLIEYEAVSAPEKRFAVTRARALRRAAAIAACLVIVLSGAAYSYQNLMVYADVTIDSEMPVKCSLNRKGEVIKIEALDESGEALAEEMTADGIKGKSADEAVRYAENYVRKNTANGEDAEFTITVDSKDQAESEKLSEELNKKYGSGSRDKDKAEGNADAVSGAGGSEAGDISGRPQGDAASGGQPAGNGDAASGGGQSSGEAAGSGSAQGGSSGNAATASGQQSGGSEGGAGSDGSAPPAGGSQAAGPADAGTEPPRQ